MSGMTREEKRAAIALLEGEAVDDDFVGDDVVYEEAPVAYEDLVGEGVAAIQEGGDEIERASRIMHRTSDQLVAKAAMRDADKSVATDEAKYVRVQPPSSYGRALGNQQLVKTGQLIDVARWAGPDNETVPITITAAAVTQLGAFFEKVAFVSPRFWRPFGVIKWGTRGFMVEAEFDIGTGVEFTINGSSAVLQLGMPDDPRAAGDPADFSVSMQLSGMLSFLPCVRTTPNTRTRFIDNEAGDPGPYIVTVPPFSRSVSVWRLATTQAILVSFLDADGFGLYSMSFASGAFNTDPIPLSDDVVFVEITNTGGGAIASARLIFNLAF